MQTYLCENEKNRKVARMIFPRLAAIEPLRNACAAKRLLAEGLFYHRRASSSFYTWGNSGLEPNLGSGNQLFSIDEAHRTDDPTTPIRRNRLDGPYLEMRRCDAANLS